MRFVVNYRYLYNLLRVRCERVIFYFVYVATALLRKGGILSYSSFTLEARTVPEQFLAVM